MTAFPVRIGIDELSTGSETCSGFAFFCLPEAYVDEFVSDGNAILSKTTMDAFHAKSYKRRFRAEYKAFVELIIEYIKKSPQSFVACRLFSLRVKRELSSFCYRVVEKAIGRSLGPEHTSIPVLQPYFLPLACLAALSRELAPRVRMRVEMDSHDSLMDLNQVVHETLGVQIEGAILLKGVYNGYAKTLHDRTPLLPDDGVTVLDDRASMMVQAADVIGNFAMAHMNAALGREGQATKAKSEIITEVMGDGISAFDPSGRLALDGENVVLTEDGGITFKAAWMIAKPPDDSSLMRDWPQDDGFLGRRQP